MPSVVVSKQKYSFRTGNIRNQTKISEYSMTVDREVVEDNRNARHLISSNIRSSLNFDLKKGIDTFIHKADFENIRSEIRLYSLCQWAVVREGETLKEVFDNVDFASSRGTYKRMASTIMSYNPRNISQDSAWTVVALKFDNVILLSEEKTERGTSSELSTYSGYKFEQYMTSDRENGAADIDSPVDNREAYEIVVKSELVSERGSLKILCEAEIDAVRGDEPIELKTAVAGKETAFFSTIDRVMQTEIAGVKSIIFGLKTDKEIFIVDTVIEKSLSELKEALNATNRGRAPVEGQCYAFLSDVLHEVKEFMTMEGVCEIHFDPIRAVVEIKSMTKQIAKERGHKITQDFADKFNLDY